jgi:hypothetical protein
LTATTRTIIEAWLQEKKKEKKKKKKEKGKAKKDTKEELTCRDNAEALFLRLGAILCCPDAR